MSVEPCSGAAQRERSNPGGEATAFNRDLRDAQAQAGEQHRNAKTRNAKIAADAKIVVAKRGDTLLGIARQHGIPIKELYDANPRYDQRGQDGLVETDRGRQGGWDPDYLRPGDRVRLPLIRLPLHGPQGGGHKSPKGPSSEGAAHSAPTPSRSPAPSPSGAPQSLNGAPPVIAVASRGQVLRGGIGVEVAGKGSATPTLGGELYVKGSLALSRRWNVNGKIKLTPQGKLGMAGSTAGNPNASQPPQPSLRARFRAARLEKVTVDIGLVFDGKIEAGGSLEVDCRSRNATPFGYLSKKDPNNVLVDRARLKVGKLNLPAIAGAIVTGGRDSLAQPRAAAKVSGRWAPLRAQVWEAMRGGEIGIAGESTLVHRNGPVSGFVNIAGKATLGDIGAGLEPTPVAGATRFAGFMAGTAASFVGAGVTDALVGKDIRNHTLRRAVDGFGGAMTGVVTDAVTQKAIPVAARAAPAVGRLATAMSGKAASLLAAAPAVGKAAGKVASIAGKIPLGTTGRVLGKVARIGGPAGALLAGVPDAVEAVKAFKNGRKADGWKAVGRGAVRVGCTAVGAVAGQALMPFLPGVGAAIGAVAGGLVGDLVAKLF